ncbi:MAG: demethoxyubiquinone hydroxylase family protein, partial [Dokdonella sp.]|uniref:demethoxyubiquinone hydroxylase family protein n=1 Tax=Dokdonella sp. TaxID=2291710 RepID=UPI003BB003BC
YGGAYAIGAMAGLLSDRLSLGFVVETERQVEAHLEGHLGKLPEADQRSRAIVRQMKEDEARHAEQAQAAGGLDLPAPVRGAMHFAANVMRALAYRV